VLVGSARVSRTPTRVAARRSRNDVMFLEPLRAGSRKSVDAENPHDVYAENLTSMSMAAWSPVPTREGATLRRALSDVKTFRADVQVASLHVEVDLDHKAKHGNLCAEHCGDGRSIRTSDRSSSGCRSDRLSKCVGCGCLRQCLLSGHRLPASAASATAASGSAQAYNRQRGNCAL